MLNAQNQRVQTRLNTTGYLGVTLEKGMYVAQIMVAHKRKWLGQYKTPEEAHEVYLVAKRKYHKGCTI